MSIIIEAQQLLQTLLVNVKQAKSYKIPGKQQFSAELANLIACTARRILSMASVNRTAGLMEAMEGS